MKKLILIPLVLLLLSPIIMSWGFFAHKLINQHAIYTLPAELAGFFKIHHDAIRDKAIDADKRCYVDSLESPRHYIDIDKYLEPGPDSIPIHWSKANEKFGERLLIARGIVPWQIYFSYQRLTQAFVARDVDLIIKHAADLGHYLADAHVPLHTTQNYNGQFSNQIGIHALWESRIPEMFADSYNLSVGRASYIEDPLALAWTIVRESNQLVASVLAIEKKLSLEFPKHLARTYLLRNNSLSLTYSDAYVAAYHKRMRGMVEQRLQQSILRLGSYWFSAWVDAGQPSFDLASLPSPEVLKVDLEDQPIIGRQEWH